MTDFIHQKIIDIDSLTRKLAIYSFKGEKIVFTNGCFDIIHSGHVSYLSQAASLGKHLIIGLNSDASVNRIKGPLRPVQDQLSRATILAAFYFVTHVVIFDEDTPYNLIKIIQPNILVKGADYHEEDIVGYDIVKAKGGNVVTIPLVEGESTSVLIQRIKKL